MAPGVTRVLLVDDQPLVRAGLRLLLDREDDIEVALEASDGAAAVTLARRERPDVVLMDISMPHMDGYEAARRLRAESWGKNVVLIALTGWGRQGDIEAARNAGFDGHLLKPVGAEALINLVNELRAQRN